MGRGAYVGGSLLLIICFLSWCIALKHPPTSSWAVAQELPSETQVEKDTNRARQIENLQETTTYEATYDDNEEAQSESFLASEEHNKDHVLVGTENDAETHDWQDSEVEEADNELAEEEGEVEDGLDMLEESNGNLEHADNLADGANSDADADVPPEAETTEAEAEATKTSSPANPTDAGSPYHAAAEDTKPAMPQSDDVVEETPVNECANSAEAGQHCSTDNGMDTPSITQEEEATKATELPPHDSSSAEELSSRRGTNDHGSPRFPPPVSDQEAMRQGHKRGSRKTSSPTYQQPKKPQEEYQARSAHKHQINSDDAIPVIMIPSFAGTRLRNWADVDCGNQGPLSSFKVGGAVWLDIKRLLTQTNCWIRCLSLIPETQEDELCVSRPDEGVDAITQVDESLPTGFLWKETIDMLASDLGYQPAINMKAHPYDWRLPPKKMEERDRTFSRLKLKIEEIYKNYKQRNPHSPHRGVFLVAMSMGNLVTQYFFQYLEYELGRKNMELWVDQYVYALVMAGAPLLGAPSIVDSVLGGETVGLPITKEQSKLMFNTWGSEPWMMPFVPQHPNQRHKAMNHEETDFPVEAVQFTTKDGRILKPSNAQIVEKNGWLGEIGDERMSKMQYIIDKWYGEDPLFGDSNSNLREPWKPPKGIDHVVCAYGVNVETPLRHVYEEDPYYPGYFRKTDQVVNHRGDVRSTKDGRRVLPARQRLAQRKSGDGSVPYFSLSWCHSWFGQEVVNITKVPANRQYEEYEIERFLNINVLDPKQKQQMEKHPHGFNTFFTQQSVDVHPDMGLQRPKSLQVWEFDGITHRDSVTHPLFLRIWKDMIKESTAFSRKYVAARERIMKMVWEEMEESGSLEGASLEGAFLSSRGKSPTSDDDCLWDYAMVRCARPRYCEYRYQIGDVHLSQSCRLRETPLAKDDPLLLLQDAEAYNVSYFVGPDRVEYQTVYRPQDPGLLPPWVQITLAFVGGAVALALFLFFVLRAYGPDRLFGNRGGGGVETE